MAVPPIPVQASNLTTPGANSVPKDETFDTRTNRRAIYIARGYIPSTDVMPAFLQALRLQVPFRIAGELPPAAARFDASQVQQALLNLLKNAHESGSRPEEVCLSVRRAGELWAVEVADRGGGMTETVMSNALVPFYSTKRSGTGLGLALAREIAEAHGGRIALNNRAGGGLSVMLFIP